MLAYRFGQPPIHALFNQRASRLSAHPVIFCLSGLCCGYVPVARCVPTSDIHVCWAHLPSPHLPSLRWRPVLTYVGIAGTLDPQVLGATSVANVSTLTSLAVVSKFDQLWGFIEQYREAHPPGPPPFPGLPIPSPVRTTR